MGTRWFQVQVVLDGFEDARSLLRQLVDERVTASGSIVGPVVSMEWDHGVRETVDRWLVLALSSEGRVHDLVARMLEERDQEAELVVLPVSFGNGSYLDRLAATQVDMSSS